jgi:Terpene synthase family 2, C-terminal metal binding
VPDVATYIEKRRHTGAIYVCMDLIEVAEGMTLPDEVFASGDFADALDAACNVVCWTNDAYSLEKERSLGEVHNLVFLMQYHENLSDAAALRAACELIDSETDRYLELEKRVLPVTGSRYPALHRYAAGMRSWMRGNHDWSSRTLRYTDIRPPEDYVEHLLREGS